MNLYNLADFDDTDILVNWGGETYNAESCLIDSRQGKETADILVRDNDGSVWFFFMAFLPDLRNIAGGSFFYYPEKVGPDDCKHYPVIVVGVS